MTTFFETKTNDLYEDQKNVYAAACCGDAERMCRGL